MPEMIKRDDPTAESRKKDHIQLAFDSRIAVSEIDPRFYYEPMMGSHPKDSQSVATSFGDKEVATPIWVSSMTGGTEMANRINHNLARACGDYGMGMGLGSCRSLLWDDDHLADFQVRNLIKDNPLYANLGIAQVEQLLEQGKLDLISELIKKLEADGLIIHVNPLQEWLQPEGDRYHVAPIQTIKRVLDSLDINIIVKEVGQGMGRESLKSLLDLPLVAVDFAANGGTNFAKLELARVPAEQRAVLAAWCNVGHSADEMVDMVNGIVAQGPTVCQQLIISGGVKDFLDGYHLTEKCQLSAVYGQASGFLKHSMGDYEALQAYVETQINGLKLAHQLLRIK